MSVLVFADSANGQIVKAAFEAVHYGSKVAEQTGTTTTVVVAGEVANDALAQLGNYGANKVLSSKKNGLSTANLAKLVIEAANAENASVVITSHDYTGKSIAGIVAVKLNAGLVTGVVALPQTDGGFSVKRAVFSGKAFAEYKITSDKKVISLLPNSIGVDATSNTAEVVDFNPDLSDNRIVVKEVRKKETTGVLLTEADLVVSGGRGLKGPENWGMIEELANEMGAGTACSRPVADIGWRPHHEHVGQTGIAVRPNLYIAVGISGAIQHLAGVNQSKVIVVINTDPEAPFFKAATYGIVGDAFQVVPKLIEAYKNFKAANN